VDADRTTYPDAVRDEGTVVYGSNSDWSYDDLKAVEAFVDQLWMPEDQVLNIDVYNQDGHLEHQSTFTHDEPDTTLERQYLPTLVVEDGFQETKKRRTDVEVKKTAPGEGGIYEMGIPVTSDEDFPFLFNVQQKTPVTERRNELDNSYRSDLMQSVIDQRLDLFEDDELSEDYVTQYISQYSHKTSSQTQQTYIERRFDQDPDDLLVYTSETPSMALTWASQRMLPMENADEHPHNIGSMLQKQCSSLQDWYDEQTDEQSIEVIEDPSEAQAEFLDYVASELVDRTSVHGVDFELAYVSEDTEDGQTHATYSPADETVYLNAFADEWNEPTPTRIGTILHELGHHESDPATDGHGPKWYKQVERLGGEVIHELQEDLDNV